MGALQALPGYHFSASFELDELLVLLGAHADFTALRIDRAGQPTQLSLGAVPRYLAHDSQRVLFAVAAEGGEQVVALHFNGQLAILPPGPTRYLVSSLDDGWWVFFSDSGEPVRFLEWREPGIRASAKILDAQDGRILAKFSVDNVDLCQTKSGTVYLRSHTALWIIAPGQPILRTRLVEEATLLATAGENALLRDDKGRPYVVENGRIHF